MRFEGEAWKAYAKNFERSAFRLEVQPAYTMPAEQDSVRRFLTGEPMPEGHNSEWHATVRANIARGKTMQRVRVVRRPLTDY